MPYSHTFLCSEKGLERPPLLAPRAMEPTAALFSAVGVGEVSSLQTVPGSALGPALRDRVWLTRPTFLSIINLVLTQCPGFPHQQLHCALCFPFANPGHPPPQKTWEAYVAF